jgi:hypothetical protein
MKSIQTVHTPFSRNFILISKKWFTSHKKKVVCILIIYIYVYYVYFFTYVKCLEISNFLLNTFQWPHNFDDDLQIDTHYGAIPVESRPPPPAWFAPDTTTDTLRNNNDARAKIWCTTAFPATSNTPDQTILSVRVKW